MNEDNYASQKLKFVSDLKGASLVEVFSLLTLFPMINFLSVLVKISYMYIANADDDILSTNAAQFW